MMHKFTVLLFFLFAIVSNVALCAPHSALTSSIIDDAHVLTTKQKQNLQSALHRVEKKHNIRVAVMTTTYLSSNKSIQRFANNAFKKYFSNGKKGGVLLLIDKMNYRWYVTFDKKIALATDAPHAIEDAIFTHLTQEDYYGAFMAYAKTTDLLVVQQKKARQKADSPFWWYNPKTLLFSFIGAFIIAFIVWRWLTSSMKTIHRAMAADNYLDTDSIIISKRTDHYLYTSTTVIPKPKTPSGGNIGGVGGGMRGGGGRF